MKYDNFRIWNAKLYDKADIRKEKKTDFIEKVRVRCQEKMHEIAGIVGGDFESKDVQYHLRHIRFPLLSFPCLKRTMDCRIRINPCLKFDPKTGHHTKIWIIIGNADQKEYFSGTELVALYDDLLTTSERISEKVRGCFLVPAAKSDKPQYYDVFAKTASIRESTIPHEVHKALFTYYPELEKEKYVKKSDSIEGYIRDLLLWNFKSKPDDPLAYLNDTFDRLTWNLVTSQIHNSSLLYMAYPEEKQSNISGIAYVPNGTDKNEQLRNLFIPTALRLSAFM